MLSGGDYTRGLEKVGMVTALELLVEFADKSTTEGQSDEEKVCPIFQIYANFLRDL